MPRTMTAPLLLLVAFSGCVAPAQPVGGYDINTDATDLPPKDATWVIEGAIGRDAGGCSAASAAGDVYRDLGGTTLAPVPAGARGAPYFGPIVGGTLVGPRACVYWLASEDGTHRIVGYSADAGASAGIVPKEADAVAVGGDLHVDVRWAIEVGVAGARHGRP